MGLFVLNMEKEPTVKGLLETAMGNLKLFQEDDYRSRSSYLLGFAALDIEKARRLSHALDGTEPPKLRHDP